MEIQFTITALLNEHVARSEAMAKAIEEAIRRFCDLDWGKVGEEDAEANNNDLRNRDGHVLARYETPEGDIYINMEFYPTGENIALMMFTHEY